MTNGTRELYVLSLPETLKIDHNCNFATKCRFIVSAGERTKYISCITNCTPTLATLVRLNYLCAKASKEESPLHANFRHLGNGSLWTERQKKRSVQFWPCYIYAGHYYFSFTLALWGNRWEVISSRSASIARYGEDCSDSRLDNGRFDVTFPKCV